MDYSKANAIQLKVINESNKLLCPVFSFINFAPAQEMNQEKMDQLFVIDHEGSQIFATCLHIENLLFEDIDSVHTLIASGVCKRVWKESFLKSHPNTSCYTKMAIYFFTKVQL